MNNNDVVKLRVTDVIHSLMKHRILIVVLTMLGLAVGIVLSIVSYMRGEMSKEYAITSSFAVTTVTQDGLFTTKTNNPGSVDVYLAENMVDSVIYVIKSDRTMNAAIDRLNLVGISTRDITSNLTLKQYGSTQIVEMTLYWRSAEEGVQILSAINSVAPSVLVDVLKIGSVSVVNEPKSKYRVGGSVNAALWVYMALIGMMAGAGFSVLELILQPTLVNTKDVESVLGLEIIGEIPQSTSYFARRRSLLVNLEDGRGAEVQEYFTSAAHILRNRLSSEKHQCIYITSAAPDEGKTSIAANLAVQLSDLEYKVLLIDFDVQNPTLGSMFLDRVEYGHSLNALYRGETTADEAVTQLTGYLDLLPAILEHRTLPLDEAMLTLIRGLAENYDYVLMDTAPVGRVADTMNLNRIAQSALFVIRYDHTSLNDIKEALIRLEKSGIRTIGCVINDVKKLGGNRGNYKRGRAYANRRTRMMVERDMETEEEEKEFTFHSTADTDEDEDESFGSDIHAEEPKNRKESDTLGESVANADDEERKSVEPFDESSRAEEKEERKPFESFTRSRMTEEKEERKPYEPFSRSWKMEEKEERKPFEPFSRSRMTEEKEERKPYEPFSRSWKMEEKEERKPYEPFSRSWKMEEKEERKSFEPFVGSGLNKKNEAEESETKETQTQEAQPLEI